MTARAWIEKGRSMLEAHGIFEASVDAWLLFQFVTGMSRADYLLKGSDTLSEALGARYMACIEQRCAHEPLQYITHVQNFMGYDFYVDEHVLIPRQDTEVLVDLAASRVGKDARILDMCTGSGCILISLCLMTHALEGLGVDLSPGALGVAEKNAETLGAQQVHFIQSDLFKALDPVTYGEYFDMIVSNPPYIASAEVLTLMPEVKDHEPMMALDGDEDGLKFYRVIVREALHYLKAGGQLLFEIGCSQAEDVAKLLKDAGYVQIEVHKDLAGLDRVVSAVHA